jgi:hypothetical protein
MDVKADQAAQSKVGAVAQFGVGGNIQRRVSVLIPPGDHVAVGDQEAAA